jgi:putative NIF3 family GTP cyclohydrolase 1 type 2
MRGVDDHPARLDRRQLKSPFGIGRVPEMPLSRREFVAAAAGLATARPLVARQSAPTAAEIIERIRSRVGVPWQEKTVDGLKAGDPATPVAGIAVAVMATVGVLRQAVASGRNFVITQEPTFYGANDAPGPRAADPTYLAKKAFIDEHRLVIYRFTDHWHARRPNPAAMTLAYALGWGPERAGDNEHLYAVPPTTLSALAADVRKRLSARGGVRVAGRSDMPVRTVYVSPGTTSVPAVVLHLSRADVVIAGEPREWEVVPYIADTWPAGRGKGLIAVGRVVSQEPGARAAAVWVKSIVAPGMAVDFVSLADPYWSPTA